MSDSPSSILYTGSVVSEESLSQPSSIRSPLSFRPDQDSRHLMDTDVSLGGSTVNDRSSRFNLSVLLFWADATVSY